MKRSSLFHIPIKIKKKKGGYSKSPRRERRLLLRLLLLLFLRLEVPVCRYDALVCLDFR
jgi:hypothetical protein